MASRARQWFTPREAAEALGMDKSNLAKLVRQGKVEAVRTGKRAWHLTAATVLALAAKRAARGHVDEFAEITPSNYEWLGERKRVPQT